jgi:hypothetical protein
LLKKSAGQVSTKAVTKIHIIQVVGADLGFKNRIKKRRQKKRKP